MMGTGAAHAVDFQIDENTEFTVNLDVELYYDIRQEELDDGSVGTVTEFDDDDSELDIKGQHTFDHGVLGPMTVFISTEFNFEADDDTGGAGPGFGDVEEANIGVRGGFGEFVFGMWDGYYDDYVNDQYEILEVISGTTPTDTSVEDAVGYSTPEFPVGAGTLQLMGLGVFKGDGDSSTPDLDGEGGDQQAYQLVGVYRYSPFELAVGFDDQGTEFSDSDGLLGVRGTLDLGAWTVTTRFENEGATGLRDAAGNEFDDGQQLYGVSLTFDYGPGELLGGVHRINEDDDREEGQTRNEVYFGGNYVLGGGLELFAETSFLDKEDDLDNQVVLGLAYGL